MSEAIVSVASDVRHATEIRVFWAPGCTSCLRMKEFLNKHGVVYTSINVMDSQDGLKDLQRHGLRTIPVIMRGEDWADGQILADVARVAGIELKQTVLLPPLELVQRTRKFLVTSPSVLAAIPDSDLDQLLPQRPRSYRQLGYHIFHIFEIFLDLAENGRRVEFADFVDEENGLAKPGAHTDLLRNYNAGIISRLDHWVRLSAGHVDYSAGADVYYGRQTLHEFLERSAWHIGQHTRQLQAVADLRGLTPSDRVESGDFDGLPMPEHVYDDALTIG